MKAGFTSGGVTNASEEECDQIYNSLKRLCDNHYGELYKRHSDSSATGLTGEQCQAVLSDESLKYFNEQDKNIIKRLFKR